MNWNNLNIKFIWLNIIGNMDLGLLRENVRRDEKLVTNVIQYETYKRELNATLYVQIFFIELLPCPMKYFSLQIRAYRE